MPVINKALGAPIQIGIGKRGQRQDRYPGLIVGPAQNVQIGGAVREFLPVLVIQKTREGVEYFFQRLHDSFYTFDRTQRVEMLDGTAKNPKTWQQVMLEASEATMAHFDSLPEEAEVEDLGALEA